MKAATAAMIQQQPTIALLLRHRMATASHGVARAKLFSTVAQGERSSSSSSSSVPRVTTSKDKDGICEVVLNRPDKLNAVDMKMFEAIAQTAADLRNDRSLRAVIIRGEGRAFCTGLDVKAVLSNPHQQTQRLLERPSGYGVPGNDIGNLAQDVSYLWRELPVPVICVLQGMCYGAGLQIALGADFRYATPDCKLSIMESKWGLVPVSIVQCTVNWLGGSGRLIGWVGSN